MSKEQTKDLLKFIKPFGDDITELVMWLREFAWDLYPQANELIYDNYNAVAFGWSPQKKLDTLWLAIVCEMLLVSRRSFYHNFSLEKPQSIKTFEKFASFSLFFSN